MARYLPFVDAIQWTGTNVTEIRQFVRANPGVINDAVIREGVLFLTVTPGGPVNFETLLRVEVTQWVVRTAGQVFALDNALFITQYTLAP